MGKEAARQRPRAYLSANNPFACRNMSTAVWAKCSGGL
jgi:hypothetical protein